MGSGGRVTATGGDLRVAPVAATTRRRRQGYWGLVYAAPGARRRPGVRRLSAGQRRLSLVHRQWTASSAALGRLYEELIDAARQSIFHVAIRNNAIFATSVPIEVVLALVLAYLIHERVPGWRLFRSAFFLPAIYSTIIVGIIASLLLLRGAPSRARSTASASVATGETCSRTPVPPWSCIIAVVVWANFGYSVLIYLAGMSSLDPDWLRRKPLDGLGGFWNPLAGLRAEHPTSRRARLRDQHDHRVRLHAALHLRDHGRRAGLPDLRHRVLHLRLGFSGSQLGYASAMGVVLAAIILVLGFIQIRMLTRTRSA